LAPSQLKKRLVSLGFEVFRTLADEVVIAERVRDNLILDSGVRIGALPSGSFRVRVVFRAQRSDFPMEAESTIFDRVRSLAKIATDEERFVEAATRLQAVTDPSNPERTLDTFLELIVARDTGDLDEALEVLRTALRFDKALTGYVTAP